MIKNLLTIFFSLISLNSYCQSNLANHYTQNMGAFIQSPNAASLGKYGDYEVSDATGVPNVSIPIYQLNSGNISLPISLSYHASGIRVSEVASWVGIGFSLNVGGIITRSVKGLPDDMYNVQKTGYFYNYSTIQNLLNEGNIDGSNPSFMDFKMAIDEGNKDYMPDVFNYNFGNKSGSFTLLPSIINNTLSLLPLLNKYEEIKIIPSITYGNNLSKFIITNDDGILYEFDSREINTETISITHPTSAPLYDASITTSWYLTSIKDPSTNALITFYYETDTITSDTSYNYQSSILLSSQNINNSCTSPSSQIFKSFSRINSLRLSKISDGITQIHFNKSSAKRKDIIGNSYSLDNITVDINGNNVKKINFITDYFGNINDPLNARLKLNKLITIESSNNDSISNYLFEYNSNTLPSRNSVNIDLWGYFNLAGNTQPLLYNNNVYRTFNNTLSQYLPPSYYTNRMPNLDGTLGCVLEKITYPTNGTTKFNFENNTYYKENALYDTIRRTNCTPPKINEYATAINTSFVIPKSTLFYFRAFKSPNKIEQSSNTSTIPCNSQSLPTSVLYKNNIPFFSFNENMEILDTLGPGTYHFETNIGLNYCDTFMRVDYKEYKFIKNTLQTAGPGLRIKSLQNYDPYSNKYETINYDYNSGIDTSSGVLKNNPENRLKTISEIKCNNNTISSFEIYNFNDLTEHTMFPSASILYSKISKSTAGANNGKIVTKYRNNSLPIFNMSFPLFVSSNGYRDNELESILYMDNQNKIVKSTSYNYEYLPTSNIYGLFMQKTLNNYSASGTDIISYMKYTIKNTNKRIKKETSIEYLNDSPVKVIKEYNYNDSFSSQPSNISIYFNDSTRDVYYYKYPRNYITNIEWIQNMINSNIQILPIEYYKVTIDKNNINKVTEGQIFNYSLLLPTKIFSLKLIEPINDYSSLTITNSQISMDNRYSLDFELISQFNGRPTEFKLNNEYNKIVYFSHKYNLISEIWKGSNNLNKTLLQKINYNSKNQVVQITDSKNIKTNFEYDGFNRLKFIKDANGKILLLKNYQYQTVN